MSVHNETWSEDDIRELISEYKRRPILWDEGIEVTDKRKKVAVWKELANVFNTTVADIQRRTNNLKSTFFDEEKKIKKMKIARRKSYVPWVHFDDLKFLNETREDGATSESDAVSGREDHVERIVPMEIESDDARPSVTSQFGNSRRSTLSGRGSKRQPMEEKEETTITRRRTIISETTGAHPPNEGKDTFMARRMLTANRLLPNSEKGDATVSARTLLSERASRLLPSDDRSSSVSQNRVEVPQPSPVKTSPFSTSSTKIAYYPQLGGLSSFSPTKSPSLYPDLRNTSSISSSSENRWESRAETSSQYSPPKVVTETASRVSPETDRITKRRRLSNCEDSFSPTKIRKLVREDDHDENGSIVSQVLSDDYDLFGAFIASEIRNLKLESSRIKLKGMIQRSIVQVAEEDNRLSGK